MKQLCITELSYLIEYIMTAVLAFAYLGQARKQDVQNVLLLLVPFSITNAVLEFWLGESVVMLYFNISLLWIFIRSISKESIVHALFLTILVFCTAMLMQVLLLFFFLVAHIDFAEYQSVAGNLATLLLATPLFYVKKLKYIYQYVIARRMPILMSIINLSAIMLVIDIYNKMFKTDMLQLLSVILIPIGFMIIMNVVMFREYIKELSNEKQAAAFQSYLPVVEEMINQVRKRQHRFDNEIQTLKGLPMVYTDYPSLCNALNEYSSQILLTDSDTTLLKLNLRFFAAFLFQKAQSAHKRGIKLIPNYKTTLLYTNVPEHELIEIAGILIDNMLEATPSGHTCYLEIDTKDNYIQITTKNPGPKLTPDLRESFFKNGYTTKDNKNHSHGFGLTVLNQYVHKYNGKIYLNNEQINDVIYIIFKVAV